MNMGLMAKPNINHDAGDEGEPSNPRLWHALTLQARARFAKYPSPAAAHWVHQAYKAKGGQFTKTKHHRTRHP